MHGTLLKSKISIVAAMICVGLFISAQHVNAASFDQYIWQKNTVSQINSAASQKYVSQLNQEVNAIVSRGSLAPLIMQYSDQPNEGYAIYHEKGRIILTLAMAYPYVSASLQGQIKTYVQSMLNGPEAFWSNGAFKKTTDGEPRRLYGVADTMPDGREFTNISTLYVIYGLWAYGDRTGDWSTVQNKWSSIKTFYSSNKSSNILYGSLSGFVAMERLARQFGDTSTQSSVLTDLNSQFNSALDPNAMETRQKNTSYGYFYDSRKVSYYAGQPWMYLNASPEVLRYISDNTTVKNDYLNRLQQFQTKFDPWWLYQTPIFNRWTGDEGIGGTPELIGMFFPAERWVKKTPAATLDLYMRSIPTGVGDSFWIEALVSTLEANGVNCWQDVRDGTQTGCSGSTTSATTTSSSSTSASPACKADISGDKFVDLSDYSILSSDFFKTNPTNPKSDINADGFVDLADYSLMAASFFATCN